MCTCFVENSIDELISLLTLEHCSMLYALLCMQHQLCAVSYADTASLAYDTDGDCSTAVLALLCSHA
jgi:hypothetical protein